MSIRIYKHLLLIFLSVLCMSVNLIAQDKVWTGAIDSSWHTAGNWTPSGVPSSGQTVEIRGNTTPRPVITLNTTVRSISINPWWNNPGDQLRIRNNATLTITDDLTLNGAAQLRIINGHVNMTATSSGSNNFSSNGLALVDITNGSFTAGTISEDLDIDAKGTFNLGNGTLTIYGDLDHPDATDTFNAENGTMHVYGNAVFDGQFNVQNGNIAIEGNTTVLDTYNGDDGTTNFNGTVDVQSGGVLNLGAGIINFDGNTNIGNNGTVNFGSGTVNIMANVNVSSGGYFNVQNADVYVTGSANFTSNGNMSVDNGSITIGGNASLSSGGVIDLNSGSLNVGGDASFTAGGQVNAGNSTITLEGDFTINNNSNFNPDSGTVVFSGDSTQTVSAGSDVQFHNVIVDSGAVFNTDGGSENTVTITGDLTVNDGGGVVVEDDDQLDVQGEVGGGGAGNVQSPAPFVVTAAPPDTIRVVLTFNKAMIPAGVQNSANYSVKRLSDNSTLTISSITLNTGVDSTKATILFTTPFSKDYEYEITMNNFVSADGGNLSVNHKKRFTKFGPITFYSITSGNWASNSTWSRVSHSGPAATKNPGNTTSATVIVGDGDVVTIASTTSITSQTSVEVKTASKLRVGSGGTLTLGTKTISGAGTFEVTTGTLKIGSPNGISSSGATGNIQTTTRTFGSSGKYHYTGTSAQITGSGLPSTVSSLTINNSNGVTIDNDLTVSGILYLTAGAFTIESGNNLIANNKTIGSGYLEMKHTITGSNGWRLLSSPIDSDFDDFFDGIITQGYSGAYYDPASLPLDSVLQPNVLYYDETYEGTDNQRWRAPSNASNSLVPGQGLYTYIFGDIATDTRYNNPFPITISVQGQENEGPVDLGVTYTAEADTGWNLVGNPYAATIDWDSGAWTKTDIDDVIYVWDYTTNQYKTWNGTTGDLPTNGLIAPFQGFWVKANDNTIADPSLIVEEGAKTTGGSFIGNGKADLRNSTHHPQFSIVLGDDNSKASAHFMFTDYASIGKDKSDAYRLLPVSGIQNYIELSSVAESGDKFAINNLPRLFGKPIEIPLQVEAYSGGYSVSKPMNFEFKDFDGVPSAWSIYLKDKKTGDIYEITEGKTIPFNFVSERGKTAPNRNVKDRPKISSKAKASDTRFVIVIKPGKDAVDLPDSFELSQNYPNPFNPSTKIEISIPIQSQVTLTIYDMLGRQVATLANEEMRAGLHIMEWNASGMASGVYIYRLITSEGVFTKKMTLIK